ncbi:hypothetical protein CALCODRAFT_509910 [Calocera cornea HHB12733]|uniref:Uncharacterized protein n=1 Tax=Calocera cornea HHB12733 TaxID=1353952 RepID=A0A165EXS1_9BASI|nr:hypothetical protein CALCODRAFT_509910 [Calocera cornea HHB12733]
MPGNFPDISEDAQQPVHCRVYAARGSAMPDISNRSSSATLEPDQANTLLFQVLQPTASPQVTSPNIGFTFLYDWPVRPVSSSLVVVISIIRVYETQSAPLPVVTTMPNGLQEALEKAMLQKAWKVRLDDPAQAKTTLALLRSLDKPLKTLQWRDQAKYQRWGHGRSVYSESGNEEMQSSNVGASPLIPPQLRGVGAVVRKGGYYVPWAGAGVNWSNPHDTQLQDTL